MLSLFLISATSIFISWYYLRTFISYLKFKNYILIDWEMICMATFGKRLQKVSRNVSLFQKLISICKRQETEGMCIVWFPPPVLFVYGAEAVKFFSNEPHLSDKPTIFYKFFDAVNSNGLFRSSGKRMRYLRKKIGPAFYPSLLKSMGTAMNGHALRLIEELRSLENHTTENLAEVIKLRTLKLFFETSLGINPDTAEKEKEMDIFMTIIEEEQDYSVHRIFHPWLHFDFMQRFWPEGKKHLKRLAKLDNIMRKVVENMKESYDNRIQSMGAKECEPLLHQPNQKSFGDALLQENAKNPSFTLDDVRTEILTLIIAGYDTASESLTWTLWLLGLHEDVQEEAYEEVKSLVDESVGYEDVQKLKYLECIIKESLRLYPVAPIFARCSNKVLQFENYTIPSRIVVAFFPYVLHRNSELYRNPESFRPDRFSGNECKAQPWTHIPFAEGVRSCIGKNYAILEMKIFLVHVIRNFRIVSVTRREDFEPTWEMMLRPTKTISVKFIPRQLIKYDVVSEIL